jgi:predicted ATP-dependent endonuclease of OLD family
LPIEKSVLDFNKSLSEDQDGVIAKANKLIRERLLESFGPVFGQDTHIQFSEVNFNRIAESLRLLFFPYIKDASSEDFRTLTENSLGYNNLLYLATVLAELTGSGDDYFSVLLIEEPEAHLHPQLQIRLLKYLESTARKKDVQVIVTTHSPVLASSVSLESIIQLCSAGKNKTPQAIELCSCGLPKSSKAFLDRWLDTTKSTLLFAKGIILVEGIAEAMLLPELAKIVLHEYDELPKTLEDGGVSVINMNGLYFRHFMQLFANLDENDSKSIPVRCAGITDNDPPTDSKPTPSNPIHGNNPVLQLKKTVNESEWARLYSGPLKTFEYDLAMEGCNLNVLVSVALSLVDTNGAIRTHYEYFMKENWKKATEDERADASKFLLEHIDKGEFAQALAARLVSTEEIVAVPGYIKNAVIWACGGKPDES